MKRLNIVLALLLSVVLFSCSNADDMLNGNSGYLKINVSTVSKTHDKGSRAIPEEYNARQLAIEILNSAGAIVKQTDDASMWTAEPIALTAGQYTVNVHSNNWDGNDSGRDVPFYAGSAQVTIAPNEKSEANIVCTLANVKVSIEFDESVAAKFASAYVEVASAVEGILPQTFTMGNEASLTSAYFPVGTLTATLHITNKAGKEYTKETVLNEVQARDHYILHYSVEESGEGQFTITADDSERTYTYKLFVPGDPLVSFNTDVTADAWANFVNLEGKIVMTDLEEIDDDHVVFQIKADKEEEWTDVAATKEGDTYKVTVRNLTDATDYSCRLAYTEGEDTYHGTAIAFATEEATQLPNSSFEDWYQASRLWYPCSQEDYSGNLFWGCSNVNAVITQINGVTGTTDCRTGAKAASLQSKYVNVIGVRKFAAGSIFTGKMPQVKGTNGATIDFGRPFTSRPTQLTGYFKYSTGAIDQVGSYPLPEGANIVKGETKDLWSAYIVLMTEIYAFDNSSQAQLEATLRDFKSGTDPSIIAYGEVADADCIEASDWTQFTANLHYFDTKTKPAYIVVVLSSSKYGDYFTGYSNSLLLVDDLELVYGEPSF